MDKMISKIFDNGYIFISEVWLGATFVIYSLFLIFITNFGSYSKNVNLLLYSVGCFSIFIYTFINFVFLVFLVEEGINDISIFNSTLIVTPAIVCCKAVFGFISLVIIETYFEGVLGRSMGRNDDFFKRSFESMSIFLLMILGMSVCLMSNNLIVFYVSLELQSFCFFILLFLGRSTFDSTEAGIRYFLSVLVSSVIFLTGLTCLYWRFGSLSFDEISLFLASSVFVNDLDSWDILFSFIILVGLSVKVGLVPMHFWVPEVYSKAKIFPVSFIATVSKIFGFFIILKLIITFEYEFSLFLLLNVLALTSITYGVISALYQHVFMRLIGFSAIAHIGYIFASVSIGTWDGFGYAIFYLITYILNVIPVLVFLLSVRESSGARKSFMYINDFRDIDLSTRLKLAVYLAFSMSFFSFIGIPPFAGFFGKFFVLKCLIANGHYFSAFIIGIFSIISAFYYLQIVKAIFFDSNSSNGLSSSRIQDNKGWEIDNFSSFLIIFVATINICFVFVCPYLLVFLLG